MPGTVKKLNVSFYNRRAVLKIARELLGKILISCFDGVYVTGDITSDTIARLHEQRVGTQEGDEDTSRLVLPNAQEV